MLVKINRIGLVGETTKSDVPGERFKVPLTSVSLRVTNYELIDLIRNMVHNFFLIKRPIITCEIFFDSLMMKIKKNRHYRF